MISGKAMPVKWTHVPAFSTCLGLHITENQFFEAYKNP